MIQLYLHIYYLHICFSESKLQPAFKGAYDVYISYEMYVMTLYTAFLNFTLHLCFPSKTSYPNFGIATIINMSVKVSETEIQNFCYSSTNFIQENNNNNISSNL